MELAICTVTTELLNLPVDGQPYMSMDVTSISEHLVKYRAF